MIRYGQALSDSNPENSPLRNLPEVEFLVNSSILEMIFASSVLGNLLICFSALLV